MICLADPSILPVQKMIDIPFLLILLNRLTVLLEIFNLSSKRVPSISRTTVSYFNTFLLSDCKKNIFSMIYIMYLCLHLICSISLLIVFKISLALKPTLSSNSDLFPCGIKSSIPRILTPSI